MCGLVGIAGDTSGTWRDVFTDLLVVDSLRGAHSTGMAAIKRYQEKVDLVKQPGGPHSLLGNPKYAEALRDPLKMMIGHNRYATIGSHTEENAHPFAFPNVVGAHNGTLDKAAIKELHGNELYGTDSQAIYCNINEHGLRDTVNKLRGAWALTWYDNKTNTVNLLRNDRRPLWYCYSKDRCTLLWASEADMLDFVLKRSKKQILDDSIYSVEADQHYSWVIPDSINKKFDVGTKVEMKAPPPPPTTYVHYYSGGHGGQSYGWQNWKGRQHNSGGDQNNVLPFPENQTGGKQNTGLTPGNSFRVKKDTTKFRPPYKMPDGKVLNKKDFNYLTANGCAFCGQNDIEWGEFIHPLNTHDGHQSFICEECYNDDDVFDICQNLL